MADVWSVSKVRAFGPLIRPKWVEIFIMVLTLKICYEMGVLSYLNGE